ncbi:MAG TPA: DUF4156 domain-containing protein [Arenimonas sp.]|uniref:DUF4156 domain-containing protein n=1 Tax=Arenimonas sp. TaxID=1872635 RepID=UPI002CCB5502|nr:DUF4156 domain-containing protein [Arenimonas sp.]HMB57127.1 DUF4156 domain-containing protein [Arenimonas sp.]
MRFPVLSAVLVLSLSACTFVKMAPGGEQIKVVAANRDMAACEKRGEIEVSVKDRLGPYSRDALRVRDELETLARNEAPGLKADTVQPKTEPKDGVQRFLAFRCNGAATPATAPVKDHDSAVTTPLKE